MENLKHTPGPWNCDETHVDNGRIQIGSPKDWIAEIYNYPETEQIDQNMEEQNMEEQKANAKLIAAAPELLEALKHAVDKFEEMGMTSGDTEYYKNIIKTATK